MKKTIKILSLKFVPFHEDFVRGKHINLQFPTGLLNRTLTYFVPKLAKYGILTNKFETIELKSAKFESIFDFSRTLSQISWF